MHDQAQPTPTLDHTTLPSYINYLDTYLFIRSSLLFNDLSFFSFSISESFFFFHRGHPPPLPSASLTDNAIFKKSNVQDWPRFFWATLYISFISYRNRKHSFSEKFKVQTRCDCECSGSAISTSEWRQIEHVTYISHSEEYNNDNAEMILLLYKDFANKIILLI